MSKTSIWWAGRYGKRLVNRIIAQVDLGKRMLTGWLPNQELTVTLQLSVFDLTKNRRFPDACMLIEHLVSNPVEDDGVVT